MMHSVTGCITSSRKHRSLKLNGSEWAWASSMRDLLEACKYRPADDEDGGDTFTGSGALMELKLEDFDLDTASAARVIQLFQRHYQTLENLALDQCSGHVDLVVTVAMTTLPKLKTLSLVICRISPTGFDPYASALGVSLQNNNSMRQLTLKAGSNVFFTLSTEAARSLAHGLSQNSMLERFELIGCRFEGAFALTSLSRGLRIHSFLKHVCIKSCFQSNGHVLGDTAMAELLFAIGEHNRQLHTLDLRGNQCHSAAITAVAKLLYRTSLRRLNLSSQCVRIAASDPRHDNADGDDDDGDDSYSGQQNIFMDLSLLVAALGRTNTLRELELRYNCLDDSDVAYLAAALKQNTSIQYLGLASNRISNVGISILATEIPYFQGLRRLDLTNNQYDGNGLVELACAMRDNKCIESVQLDNTDCNVASASSLTSRAQLDSIASWKVIRYYCDLNASGRRHLNQPSGGRRIIDALWPLVLSRASSKLQDTVDRTDREADIFFAFLRHHPNIFPT